MHVSNDVVSKTEDSTHFDSEGGSGSLGAMFLLELDSDGSACCAGVVLWERRCSRSLVPITNKYLSSRWARRSRFCKSLTYVKNENSMVSITQGRRKVRLSPTQKNVLRKSNSSIDSVGVAA